MIEDLALIPAVLKNIAIKEMNQILLNGFEDRDDDFEIADATERSEDLKLTALDFGNLVIAPADWTIETLYGQIGNQIDLDPAFQRRNVWNSNAKSSFIESLFLGIPIPQILLSSKVGQRNSFLVLDGKQRLLTIKEFLDGRFPDGRPFKLRGLRVLKELEGKTWDDLKSDPEWSQRLLNETQRTAVIRNWTSEPVLYEIFFRLNSGSVKLSPMELRMSLHPGDFLKYIIKWTEKVSALHTLIGKKDPDPRMNDVELAVRFLGFSLGNVVYKGDLKQFLDETCILLNDSFENNDRSERDISSHLDNMTEAISLGLKVMGRGKFCKKYTDGKYESRFNRAIFDVEVGALASPDLRARVSEAPEKFEQVFLKATEEPDFVRAVETTTKSTNSTRTRFQIFYKEIEAAYGLALKLPKIAEASER